MVQRTFPLNCTATFTLSATNLVSSRVGRWDFVKIENSFPNFSQNSSAKCGANGASKIMNVSNSFLSIFSSSDRRFMRIINWEMQVLNLNASMSSVVFLMV